jgi:hypothetical protein
MANNFNRRSFLGMTAAAPLAAQTTRAPATKAGAPTATYDVIVCGGGNSGLPAAVAAARAGAKVALFERYGFMGGNPALGLMTRWAPGPRCGMLLEFMDRVDKFGVGPVPLIDEHVEPEVVKILFQEMALESGVHLYLHHFAVGVVKDGNQVTALVTESKSGRRTFGASAFIDASGDGDVAYHAGAKYELETTKLQAMTLVFRIGHIDFVRFEKWAVHEDHEDLASYHRAAQQINRRDAAGNLREGIPFKGRMDKLWNQYRSKYPDLPEDPSYFNCHSLRPNEICINATRAYDLDPTNADDLTKAEVSTRKQVWAIWRFLRDNVPGFERSALTETAPQIGIRESRRIIGDYVLTLKDGATNRRFEDSVMTSRVSLDLHEKSGHVAGTDKLSIRGGLVDFPYRCLHPKGIERLMVVGRCGSVDHIFNSGGPRKMGTVFTMGEVAGTAAAMAVKEKTTPRSLSVKELQAELTKKGLKTSQGAFSAEELKRLG